MTVREDKDAVRAVEVAAHRRAHSPPLPPSSSALKTDRGPTRTLENDRGPTRNSDTFRPAGPSDDADTTPAGAVSVEAAPAGGGISVSPP